MQKIFVIVVTYKGRQWYDKCFSSLCTSIIPVQTIVVDNTPGEEDAKYIQEHFPEIHLIKTKENLGFGQANNIGMRYALDHGCDYVFLLNQDAWIEPNAIEILINTAEKYPEYGILAPSHTKPNKIELEPDFMSFLKDNKNTDGSWFNDMYWNHVKELYETQYIHAAGWLLPRKTLEIVGGFDPLFFHYEEDDNYLHRTLYHHLKVGVSPFARMVHDCNRAYESSKEISKRRCQQEMLVKFTNINIPSSAEAEVRHMYWLILKFLLQGKFKESLAIWDNARYFSNILKNIEYSRSENKKRQTSWL